jgi:Zn-dependent protease
MNFNNLISEIAILAPPFLLALTAHEYSHGLVAYRLGDPTASNQGRLTMNPLKHLDPLGVLAFIIMKIGWAKPIPIDARYFKNPQQGLLWVSLAGVGANFLLAAASGIAVKLLLLLSGLLPGFFFWPLIQMTAASVWINLMLGVFNLLPIPPLDGSKLVLSLLPAGLAGKYQRLEPFGFIILLLLFYTGILSKILLPIITFAQSLIIR